MLTRNCIIAAFAGMGAAFHAAAQQPVEVSGAWIAETPPGVELTAGYMEIHNPGPGLVVLIDVSSQQFRDVQIHLSELKDGQAVMRLQESVEIPAGQTLSLRPGGYHLMLFDPDRPLRHGDTVLLRLDFSDGSSVSTNAAVKRRSGPGP